MSPVIPSILLVHQFAIDTNSIAYKAPKLPLQVEDLVSLLITLFFPRLLILLRTMPEQPLFQRLSIKIQYLSTPVHSVTLSIQPFLTRY